MIHKNFYFFIVSMILFSFLLIGCRSTPEQVVPTTEQASVPAEQMYPIIEETSPPVDPITPQVEDISPTAGSIESMVRRL